MLASIFLCDNINDITQTVNFLFTCIGTILVIQLSIIIQNIEIAYRVGNTRLRSLSQPWRIPWKEQCVQNMSNEVRHLNFHMYVLNIVAT